MANTLFNPTKLQAVLRDLAHDVEQGYIDSLLRNGHKASGDLISSVSTEVVVNGTTYEAVMHWDVDYWEYVEYDTKPHWPPLDAIARWIEIKPILPRPSADGRIPTTKQLAFLIGRAMAGESPNQPFLKNPQGGTTGTHDFQKAKDAIIPFYEQRLLDALGRDTIEYIQKITG